MYVLLKLPQHEDILYKEMTEKEQVKFLNIVLSENNVSIPVDDSNCM